MSSALTTAPGTIQSPVAAYIQSTPTGPVTLTCPEVAQTPTMVPTQTCSFYISFFVATQLFNAPVTVGGPGPGVASGMTFGPATPSKGSTKVFIQGQAMARSLTDPGFNNSNGASGNSIGVMMPNQATLQNISA